MGSPGVEPRSRAEPGRTGVPRDPYGIPSKHLDILSGKRGSLSPHVVLRAFVFPSRRVRHWPFLSVNLSRRSFPHVSLLPVRTLQFRRDDVPKRQIEINGEVLAENATASDVLEATASLREPDLRGIPAWLGRAIVDWSHRWVRECCEQQHRHREPPEPDRVPRADGRPACRTPRDRADRWPRDCPGGGQWQQEARSVQVKPCLSGRFPVHLHDL
jgi:hypothetical protein